MIYRDIISRHPWAFEISDHALRKAKERGIHSFMIEAAIKCGRIEHFGKNYMKFIMEYKRGKLICVGEKKACNLIRILTIEWG